MSDLFGNDVTPTAEDLVGEGKKFKTIDDLAKGKAQADTHITNLEKELAELRQDLSARLTVEDFVSRVGKPRSESENNQVSEPVDPPPPNNENKVLAGSQYRQGEGRSPGTSGGGLQRETTEDRRDPGRQARVSFVHGSFFPRWPCQGRRVHGP